MAVANSTIQIALPGLDANVQNNLNTALNSNPTILQILSNFQAAGSFSTLTSSLASLQTAVQALPTKEPYPYFSVWTNYNNTPYWNEYDSNMSQSGSYYADTNNELLSAYNGNNYTNGNFGGGGFTSYWTQATPFQQADGHWMINLHASNAGYIGKEPSQLQNYYPFFGVVIGTSGKRQKVSLYQNNSTIGVYPRGQTGAYEQFSINNTALSTWYGGTSYGMIGYNERTGTLVVLEAKDANNNYRMHIWVNTSLTLNGYNYTAGTLWNFLSQAKLGGTGKSYNYYDFQWQANSSQNYTESRYRMRVIPGDNNIVGMVRQVPQNTQHYAYYTPSAATLTQLNTLSVNSAYGIDSGNYYGIRHNITWDNNWVASYSPYYAYGCGMNVHFVDARDPRNYYMGQNGDTNNGCQLVPFKSNKFMFNQSVQNSDTWRGLTPYIIDLEGAKVFGRITSGTIVNGGTIVLTANQQYGLFDTQYTSTNYPGLIQPTHYRIGDIR